MLMSLIIIISGSTAEGRLTPRRFAMSSDKDSERPSRGPAGNFHSKLLLVRAEQQLTCAGKKGP